MKKTFSLLVVLAILAGCKKDKTVSPAPVVNKKLERISSLEYPGTTQHYSYDASGRLTNIEDSFDLATYSYNGNTVNYSNFSKTQNSISRTAIITLNNKGFASAADVINTPNPNVTNNWHYTYEYDAEDKLVKVTQDLGPAGIQEITNEFANGNKIQATIKKNGAVLEVDKYTYSNNIDKLGLGSNYLNNTFTMGGIQNKNLLTKKETFDGANNKTNEFLYQYETDADGYQSKFIYTIPSTAQVYHYTYIYTK